MKQEMVGDVPGKVLGMYADLSLKLQNGVITVPEFALFLQRKNPFAITDIQQEWQEFYRKYFRMTVDFSDVIIPDDPGGFDRAIFIPKGLTFADVIKAMRKYFEIYLYTENLDNAVTENVRTSSKNYTVRVRELQEADEDFKNLSANELKKQGKNCLTLLERLVYELKYWSETDQHLDINNWTLCAGSRGPDGYVPSVSWNDGDRKLQVYWYNPDYALGFLRARQAVSN